MHKNWISLTSIGQLNEILDENKNSGEKIVLFKHSTRCSISTMALSRLERASDGDILPVYYLDLLKHRDVSNAIAEFLGVEHQSPQIIVVQNGKTIKTASHHMINGDVLQG